MKTATALFYLAKLFHQTVGGYIGRRHFQRKRQQREASTILRSSRMRRPDATPLFTLAYPILVRGLRTLILA